MAGSLEKRRECYVYINNRLEGCAPLTIEKAIAAIAAELHALRSRPEIIEVRSEGGMWTVRIAENTEPIYARKEHAISYGVSPDSLVS